MFIHKHTVLLFFKTSLSHSSIVYIALICIMGSSTFIASNLDFFFTARIRCFIFFFFFSHIARFYHNTTPPQTTVFLPTNNAQETTNTAGSIGNGTEYFPNTSEEDYHNTSYLANHVPLLVYQRVTSVEELANFVIHCNRNVQQQQDLVEQRCRSVKQLL